jgi:hypothetical protein
MLQMLNVDNKKSNDTYNHSDRELSDDDRPRIAHSKRGDKELLLPIVRPVGNKLNMSDGNIGNDELPAIDDEYHLKPKV